VAAGARLAFAQAEHQRDLQRLGQAVQRVLLDQIGPHARQLAFAQAAKRAVQHVGNGQVQHGIAEEFEPLVVVRREAAVRQRPLQQRGLRKVVPQPRLQQPQGGGMVQGTHASGNALRT